MCLVAFDWTENDAIKKFNDYEIDKGPSWGYIELTTHCNFNCLWCFAGKIQNPAHMSLENSERVLEILANSGIKQITCSGGEPLLYPHLKCVIKTAKDYGMIVHMDTNGFFLTKKLAEELKKLGLTQIQTNIDSLHPYKHDIIRGKGGSFDRAVKAMKNAIEAGIVVVSQTVVNKQNEKEIFGIMQFARDEIGVNRFRVWDATPSGTALENTQIIPLNYLDLLQRISNFAKDLGAKHILSYEPLFLNDNILPITSIPCPSSRGSIVHILTSGDVVYCVTVRDEVMYNLFDYDDIREIHKRKVNEKNKHILKCSGCNEKCYGGCPSRIKLNLGKDYQCNKPVSLSRRMNDQKWWNYREKDQVIVVDL